MKKFFLRLAQRLRRAKPPASPSDPFLAFGPREWADLPVYHPPRDPEGR